MSLLRYSASISLDGDGIASLGLEQVRVTEAPGVTHLTYRRVG
ncbi:MAG TPA: hypothetical protein VHS27_19175 [Gaiellales bacterium]|jgi:hypothetical protein|nr:hypothetical protein [Gaiellales bacterium]